MKRFLLLLLCCSLLITLPVSAGAPEEESGEPAEEPAATADVSLPEAEDITAQCTIYCNGGLLGYDFTDNSFFTRGTLPAGSVLKAVCSRPIGGVYIRFDQLGANLYPGAWTLEVNGETRTCGENGFQQQYQGGFSATELTITFPEDVGISDIYFLSEGSLPDWVHDWQPEPEKVDVLLMSCHSDDDQYTFTGLIPWCLSNDMVIHVAYFINHYTHPNRVHELLDGLWASGMRNYPTMGRYRDEEHETTLQSYINTGVTEEQLVGTQVEVIRRFQPQIVVTHDVNGEYGHGGHVLYTQLILQALPLTGDASQYPESAAQYGVWEVPKVYVHLQKEGEVVLDFDTPLERFGGRTAYNVGQDAFRYDVSQTWYAGQMSYMYSQDKASEVSENPPNRYGLYSSTVGSDTLGNTLFENILSYAQQEELAEEEAARLAAEEAERAAAEEAARLEAEAAQEAAAAQEIQITEQKQAEDTAWLATREAEAAERSAKDRRLQLAGIAAGIFEIVLAAVLLILLFRKKPAKVADAAMAPAPAKEKRSSAAPPPRRVNKEETAAERHKNSAPAPRKKGGSHAR